MPDTHQAVGIPIALLARVRALAPTLAARYPRPPGTRPLFLSEQVAILLSAGIEAMTPDSLDTPRATLTMESSTYNAPQG